MSDQKLVDTAHHVGDGVAYYDGKPRFISNTQLREIKSTVVTHEGQHLTGKEARKYMDNHSKECLGKDLSGSYNSTEITGYVRK